VATTTSAYGYRARGPQGPVLSLESDWLFGGPIAAGPDEWSDVPLLEAWCAPETSEERMESVSLPHTVVPLSWNKWNPSIWEHVWIYRRHFDGPQAPVGSVSLLHFESVMTAATVVLNGHRLGKHFGGYLPFAFDVTGILRERDNVLAVLVDSRFDVNVPPNAPFPVQSSAIDFWQPGGITGRVYLQTLPAVSIADVQLTPLNVLSSERSLRAAVTLRAIQPIGATQLRITVSSPDGAEVASEIFDASPGPETTVVELAGLADIRLWDVEAPQLYHVDVELLVDGAVVHEYRTRTGFREARFETDGFFLNGKRVYLRGVNRHGYYPFVGFAMPDRAQARDAAILRHELNSMMVRCAHYPPAPAFLDACDELGLLVWEEPPGWQFVGDAEWRGRVLENITDMIARDINRPSIILWAARLNETPDLVDLYGETEALVKKLDPSRATSGTMHGPYWQSVLYQHDVFSYDDYSTGTTDDGDRYPVLLEPQDPRPYLVAETVAARSSPTVMYRRGDLAYVQQHQSLDYSIAHDIAMGNPRFTGLLAWVAFDYQTGAANVHHGVKAAGLGDVFRILKPGAAIYRAQVSPQERIVLEPAFTWDPWFDEISDRVGRDWGPGANAIVCSNCERIDVYLDDIFVDRVSAARDRFGNLEYPPFFVDLSGARDGLPELRIDGVLDGAAVISRRWSGSHAGDVLSVEADDAELVADGVDVTRVVIGIADRFGNLRGKFLRGAVAVEVSGPGQLLGEAQLSLEDSGGVGAVWVKSVAGLPGTIVVRAQHDSYGAEVIQIRSLSGDHNLKRAES
jgi:beta-galactosidase